MLETPRFSTVKLKNISEQEVSYLPSHFILYLEKEFIDLGLHFDFFENES